MKFLMENQVEERLLLLQFTLPPLFHRILGLNIPVARAASSSSCLQLILLACAFCDGCTTQFVRRCIVIVTSNKSDQFVANTLRSLVWSDGKTLQFLNYNVIKVFVIELCRVTSTTQHVATVHDAGAQAQA